MSQSLAGAADARQFRMTGNWVQNIAIAQIPIFGGIDNLPDRLVSATGSSPATLTIPVHAFRDPAATFIIPVPVTSIVQISAMLSHFGPSAPGVFSPGPKTSRPLNFAFCPGAAANPACTTPAIGGAQGTQHGMVSYTAGSNQFGGTMRMLSSGPAAASTLIGISPTRIQHNPLGQPAGIPVGAGYAGSTLRPSWLGRLRLARSARTVRAPRTVDSL